MDKGSRFTVGCFDVYAGAGIRVKRGVPRPLYPLIV